jgi:hypothetical protein
MSPGNNSVLTLVVGIVSFLSGYYIDPDPAPTSPPSIQYCVNKTVVKPWLVAVVERESFASEAGSVVLLFLVVLSCCCNCCSPAAPRRKLQGQRIVPQ